jgi:cyclopropane fatty-acyl-phospholipid synthase-like methyltransferase
MPTDEQVKKHFDLDADRFDAIYESRKGPFARFVDDVWRGVVKERYKLTLDRFTPLAGERVLDVGCGSGRYSVALARAGAGEVVGIDFAPKMIDLADRNASELGVANRCTFRVASFPDVDVGDCYDISLAIGYFDYVSDAEAHLRCLREITSGTLVASFPQSSDFRVPIRRLRFALARCPLFLYARPQVEQLLVETGWDRHEMIDLKRDYLVFAGK